MQTTENYGLKTYQSGDLFNPLTVDNANMTAIDTDMKAISDRAIGRATELVSGGVHAITLLDTDCKTFKFVATGNYASGETFTVNGIQVNAYVPTGEALGNNAYKTGSVVMASLNADNSALTFYVPEGSVAVAADSEKLGGELPAYYSTKSYADSIKSTADNASELITKKALVNTYYDTSDKKLYLVNSNGTLGGEIKMGGIPALNYTTPLHTFDTNNSTFTASKECYLAGSTYANGSGIVSINNNPIASNNGAYVSENITYKISTGDVVTVSVAFPRLHIFDTV